MTRLLKQSPVVHQKSCREYREVIHPGMINSASKFMPFECEVGPAYAPVETNSHMSHKLSIQKCAQTTMMSLRNKNDGTTITYDKTRVRNPSNL